MKIARLLIIITLVCGGRVAAQGPKGGTTRPAQRAAVDADFAYPEAREIDDLGVVLVRSLRGRVVDVEGNPVHQALVERLSVRGRRLEATLTDADGYFRLGQVREGQHSLRVSYPGYDTLILQARTARGNSGDFELTLLPPM